MNRSFYLGASMATVLITLDSNLAWGNATNNSMETAGLQLISQAGFGMQQTDIDAEANGIVGVAESSSGIPLTPEERMELRELVAKKMASIRASGKAGFLVNQMKTKLTQKLQSAKSVDEMRTILGAEAAPTEEKTVLSELGEVARSEKREHVEGKVKERLEENAAERVEKQIEMETDRVMKEGGAETIQDIASSGRGTVRKHIRSIVSKYYKKEIPNLTMQDDPVGALITLVKSKKRTRAAIDRMLAEFDADIAMFEHYVREGKKYDEQAVTSVPLTEQMDVETNQVIGASQLLYDSKKHTFDIFFKFNQGKNPDEKVAFSSLRNSKHSGFVIVPIGTESNWLQVNLKFLTLSKKGNKADVGFQMMKFNVLPDSAQWLKDLVIPKDDSQGPAYEFWGISTGDVRQPYAVFAVPQEESEPIWSLSLPPKADTGKLLNDIKLIMARFNPIVD